MELEDLSEIDADKPVEEELMNEKKQQLHHLAETIMQILMVCMPWWPCLDGGVWVRPRNLG